MYNAMLRKGYDDTPEDAVESMVAVHNFLNEGAWEEIEGWEKRFSRGLSYGWQICRRGEEGFVRRDLTTEYEIQMPRPKLLRFQGRPNDITPKAKILEIIGKVYPAKYRWGQSSDAIMQFLANMLAVLSLLLTGMIGTCNDNCRMARCERFGT